MKRSDGRNTVAVVGLGYVGLTLSVVMADAGFQVSGIDIRKKNIKSIKDGTPPIHENLLPQLLRKHINKRFKIYENFSKVKAKTYIIAVGTPVVGGVPDLSSVISASESIGKRLGIGDLVIVRSTVPIGTTRGVIIPTLELHSQIVAGKGFSVAFAPERMVEGDAIQEMKTIPQIIGGLDWNSTLMASNVFKLFMEAWPVTVGSLEAAEMVKLFNNT